MPEISIEGVDVASDSCADALASSALAGVPVDVVIHNAGASSNDRSVTDIKQQQNFDGVTTECMLGAFQVNTLGPLRVQKFLDGQMVSPGGKVIVISTGMGSINDNGSGGMYAYRVSKAAVNMLAVNMKHTYKDRVRSNRSLSILWKRFAIVRSLATD